MRAMSTAPTVVKDIVYGSDDIKNQFLRIYPPVSLSTSNAEKKYPVVFLIHGGFWRDRWNIDNALLIDTVPDLNSRGVAVCAIEYRRNGQENNGGGVPGTMEDYVSAMCKLADLSATPEYSFLDTKRVTLCGHSAGGHAVLWLSSQRILCKLPFTPHRCVALAPVCDMVEASSWTRDGDHPVADFLAARTDNAVADPVLISPSHLLPLAVPTLLISASGDEDVPPTHVRTYFNRATTSVDVGGKGAYVRLLELEGAHHYSMIDPTSSHWQAVAAELCADALIV